MNIGETIQYHRKRLGLSQEDLGQQLNLSRQTVSLWENGQTVPTVDNFVRLKEIFGVSVDNLLGCEEYKAAETEVKVVGTYTFQYTKTVIDHLFKRAVIDFFKDPFLYFVVFIESLLFTWEILGYGDTNLFMVAMLVIFFTTYEIRGILGLKNYRDSLPNYLTTVYEYIFYEDDTLVVNTYKNNNLVITARTPISEIKNITVTDDCIHIQVGVLYFLATKDILQINNLADKLPHKIHYQLKPNAWSAGAWILFFASLIAAFAGLEAVAIYSRSDLSFAYHWVFAVMAIFPIASVVYGIFLKRKKIYKYKKNVIAGIIALLFLCLCVLGTFYYASLFI